MRVLVGYSSKYGATAGIAERIAATLQTAGVAADARPLASADDLTTYDAFVIGASAYMGSWRKDATEFVHSHTAVLAGHPVWLFSSGPLGTETTDAEGKDLLLESQPRQFADFATSISPRAMQVFFGALDLSKLRGRDRLVSKIPAVEKILPNGDFRDWTTIDAWARSIARTLASTTGTEDTPTIAPRNLR